MIKPPAVTALKFLGFVVVALVYLLANHFPANPCVMERRLEGLSCGTFPIEVAYSLVVLSDNLLVVLFAFSAFM